MNLRCSDFCIYELDPVARLSNEMPQLSAQLFQVDDQKLWFGNLNLIGGSIGIQCYHVNLKCLCLAVHM